MPMLETPHSILKFLVKLGSVKVFQGLKSTCLFLAPFEH